MNNESSDFWNEQWQQFVELVRLWIAHEQAQGRRMSCDALKLLEHAGTARRPTSFEELVVSVQLYLSLLKGAVEHCKCDADRAVSAEADSNGSSQVDQKIEESLEESFPASDPPSWTGTHL